MNLKDVIENRRAVNFFDPKKKVGEEKIKEMINMAAKSPSSFNLQPWSLMILSDQETKERLKKLAWDQPKVVEAPVIMIFLADRNGWQEGHPFVEKNFKEMIKAGSMSEEQHDWFLEATKSLYGTDIEKQTAFAAKNTAFFAMSLMYAAKSLGLNSHPMDGFDHDGVKEEFKIPDQYWIPLLLAVGHFNTGETLVPPKWRKTYDEIVVNFD